MRLFRRRDAGFTIIEVLVALTLLAAVILLVTPAFLAVLSDQPVGAAPGQEDLLLPCWSVEWTRGGGCVGQPGYAPDCTNDANLTQDDRLRWVTVEVFFQGGGEPVARMTSAIMRGAYHR